MTVILFGCASASSTRKQKMDVSNNRIPASIQKEASFIESEQNDLKRRLEKTEYKPVDVDPVVPQYDPLADHIVSFSMVDEGLDMILYTLSKAVGMNFIIDPSIGKDDKKMTLNFNSVSASLVLKELLRSYDLYYEVSDNVIRIRPFEEKIFKVNFLDTNVKSKFEVGGDVFGAGSSDSATGLAGSFKLEGDGGKQVNAYDIIEKMLGQVVSKDGRFALNRMAGTLFIKDRPTVIHSASLLLRHFREMLDRQILIEARIVEVSLSDEYRYGIDWNVIKNLDNAVTEFTEMRWSLGKGLIMSGTSDDFSIGVAIDALNTFGETTVVSNPTLRSTHGRAAMISVGTSYTYKKSVETRSTTTNGNKETTTEVEVSSVFDGLILGVIPFIDEGGRVHLLINPIKSDVDQTSLEPESVADGLGIALPKVGIKEISTSITLQNGDVAILGGLIDKRKIAENSGVPLLSRIPLFGYLFKNEKKFEETRELVIILSVSLV